MPATDTVDAPDAKLAQEKTQDQTGVYRDGSRSQVNINSTQSTWLDKLLGIDAVARPNYQTFRKIVSYPPLSLVRAIANNPILSNSGGYVVRNQSLPNIKKVKAFIEAAIEPMYKRLVKSMLTSIDNGCKSWEQVWEHGSIFVPGDEETGSFRQTGWFIQKFKPLKVDYTDPIVDYNGNLIGVQNKLPKKPAVKLYGPKFFHYAYDGEDGNPYGRSRCMNLIDNGIWNSIVMARKRLDNYLRTISGPTTHLTYPDGTNLDQAGAQTSNYIMAARLMEARARGESTMAPGLGANVIDPKLKGELAGKSDWVWQDYEAGGVDYTNGILADLVYHDSLCFDAWLRPARVGLESKHGSRADAKEHTDTSLLGTESDELDLNESINRGPIDYLLLFNFGEEYVGSVERVPSKQESEAAEIYKSILDAMLQSKDPQVITAIVNKIGIDKLLADVDVPVRPGQEGDIELKPQPDPETVGSNGNGRQ